MIWLANNWRWLLFVSLLVLCAWLYDKSGAEEQRADAAESSLKLARDTINDMQVRQRDVAALDAKYTGELADAKTTIDQLQRDVAAGHQRLRVNATCPKGNATGTASVDDAARARLTDAAQRDYFTLRERISTITQQLTGLQQYVREQCMR